MGALGHLTAIGWERISDERAEPDMFYLPDFAAPEPAEEQQPETPAEPAEEDEEQ